MNGFRSVLQHYFNPLHVYCRLCEFGIAPGAAQRMCGWYERVYRVALA